MALPQFNRSQESSEDSQKKNAILKTFVVPLTNINQNLKDIITFVKVEKNRVDLAREEAESEARGKQTSGVSGGIAGFIKNTKSLFGDLARRFIVFLAPAIMSIYEAIKKVAPAVVEFTQKATAYIVEAGNKMATIVSTFVSDVVTRVGNAISSAFSSVLEVAEQYFLGITKVVTGVIDSINSFVTKISETGKNIVATIVGAFTRRDNTPPPTPTPTPAPTPAPRNNTVASPVSGGGNRSPSPPQTTPTARAPTIPARTTTPDASTSSSLLNRAMAQLAIHEGRKNKPYKDSRGLWTVGIGHLIGDGKSLPAAWNRTFTEAEIDALFQQDFAKHLKIAQKTPGWAWANETQKLAMIDLAFNMGAWFSTPTWRNGATVAALARGAFADAAARLKSSAWASQVGNRAVTVTKELASGGNRIAPPQADLGATVSAATNSAGTGAIDPPSTVRPRPSSRQPLATPAQPPQTNNRPAAGTGVDQNAVRGGYLRRLFGG